jgi:molecular chaperone GrpE
VSTNNEMPNQNGEKGQNGQNSNGNGIGNGNSNSNSNPSGNSTGNNNSNASSSPDSFSMEELKKTFEEWKTKAEENWNQFLRARAEMENLRRRAELDIDNARKFAIERFAKEMLGVVDSLEHGLAVAESEHDAAYRAGMELTLKLCLDIFEKFSILPIIPTPGEPFDPNRHEAISIQESKEVEPNRILVVAQKGFMFHDRVLRPARVVVSR